MPRGNEFRHDFGWSDGAHFPLVIADVRMKASGILEMLLIFYALDGRAKICSVKLR